MKYKNFDFFEFNENLVNEFNLKKVIIDSTNWRTNYKNNESNWILFYPFSEYHGGGQSFIINIQKNEFENWITENIEFEKNIRKKLDEK